MIGKISIGKSFYGCLNYCLEDKRIEQSQEVAFRDRAEVLFYHRCYGTKQELVQQFSDVRALNPKLQKPVLHVTLSLAPGEQLSRAKLIDIAEECACSLGFDKNQYVVVRHEDTEHQHLHIVANRIGFDGKTIQNGNDYKKIADCCRKMEAKYGLKQVLNPQKFLSKEQRQLPRQDSRKEKLREDLRQCLLASKNHSDFEHRMKQKGYRMKKGRGIAFVDEKAVRIKGSEVGFPLQKIEKILALQEQLKLQQQRPLEQGAGIK